MEINFRHDHKCFNFRVASVIKKDNKILLSHSGSFYTLPGGRVSFGETTEHAVKRIVYEELDINTEIIKLLSINENFFEYGDDDYHELLFVYLCEPGREADVKSEKYTYVPLEDLLNINIKPEFLLSDLKQLSNSIIHNVNK